MISGVRWILDQLSGEKDAILAFAAISASFFSICAIIAGLWQTNRTLSTTREVAERQLGSTISTNYRQKWIADFTEHVGRALSLIASIHLPGTESGSKERQDQLIQLQYHQARIQLLSRSDHPVEGAINVLIKDAIHEMTLILQRPMNERDYEKLDQLTGDIVKASRIVVSDEEERVKCLE